jgi:hypothetical protein
MRFSIGFKAICRSGKSLCRHPESNTEAPAQDLPPRASASGSSIALRHTPFAFHIKGVSVHVVLRRLQLLSGLVLLTYLFLHLVNHALGIWSLDLAGRGLTLAIRLWHSWPGTLLLYGAAALHFSLALRTIYGRRDWGLPPAEWVRLWAGLSLPLLLIRHAVSTRLAASLYGFEPNYERIVVLLITSGTQGLDGYTVASDCGCVCNTIRVCAARSPRCLLYWSACPCCQRQASCG